MAGTQGPLAPKTPPWPASAKSVISLFMQGGPSQVDTFDPKPLLAKLNGQHPPDSFGNEDFQNGKLRDSIILGSKRTFKKYGQSGIEVSDLFPYVAQQADQIAVIRSCHHEASPLQAKFLMNNGFARIGRPSLGSWILYGLGTENQNLLGFVVLLEVRERAGSLRPGTRRRHQGTSFLPGRNPILNLSWLGRMQAEEQRDLPDTLRKLNERHLIRGITIRAGGPD